MSMSLDSMSIEKGPQPLHNRRDSFSRLLTVTIATAARKNRPAEVTFAKKRDSGWIYRATEPTDPWL
jgi:hypothetical protein